MCTNLTQCFGNVGLISYRLPDIVHLHVNTKARKWNFITLIPVRNHLGSSQPSSCITSCSWRNIISKAIYATRWNIWPLINTKWDHMNVFIALGVHAVMIWIVAVDANIIALVRDREIKSFLYWTGFLPLWGWRPMPWCTFWTDSSLGRGSRCHVVWLRCRYWVTAYAHSVEVIWA